MSNESFSAMEVFHPDVIANPYPFYAKMRAHAPVYWEPGLQSWLITGYHEVAAALKTEHTSARIAPKPPETPLSQELMELQQKIGGSLGSWLAFLDPPHHRPLRNLMAGGFRPRLMNTLHPVITDLVNELLDDAQDQQLFNAIGDLAYPLAVSVIAQLLGIPKKDHHLAKRWTHITFQYMNDHTGCNERAIRDMAVVIDEMTEYFSYQFNRRKIAPTDDFLNSLLEEMATQEIELPQVYANCFFLFIAGQDTTVNALGNTLSALDQFPNEKQRLINQAELIPKAVEELLRYDTPTQFLLRTASADFELAGHTIEQGQKMMIFLGSANHDERIFQRPTQLRLDRNPNPHLSFGQGIHICLGMSLARLEISTVLAVLNQRFPKWRLAAEGQRRNYASLRGFVHLPIRLGPAT